MSGDELKQVILIGVGSVIAIAIGAYHGLHAAKPDRHEATNNDNPPIERQVSVVSKIDVGDGGTVTVLSVPDPVLASSPLLDNRCLIYVNKESQKAVMACLPSGPASE